MIITIASFKGGVGKTTTAVHLATYLQTKKPTLLIDGDVNRSATGWARRGQLPFRVVDVFVPMAQRRTCHWFRYTSGTACGFGQANESPWMEPLPRVAAP